MSGTANGVAPAGSEPARDDRWVSLMYHDVLPDTPATGGGPERFAVPLASFEATLDVIAEAGYLGCSLATALEEVGRPRVAITFDDGTRSNFDFALPALRARSMTATFFITTDWVGQPGFMTWSELRELKSLGMSVQSHTRSHPFLSELDEASLRSELAGSKAELDRQLDQDTTQIGLPGGDSPRRALRHLLADCGYDVVAGSKWGVNDDHSRVGGIRHVRRCTVRGRTPPTFARRVVSGDPWLALRRYPREATLAGIRSTLGAGRYSRWRRSFLDALAGADRT